MGILTTALALAYLPFFITMVLQYDPKRQCLPSSAELPDSDDTPADNELQNLVPNLLASTLALAWPVEKTGFLGWTWVSILHPKSLLLCPMDF